MLWTIRQRDRDRAHAGQCGKALLARDLMDLREQVMEVSGREMLGRSNSK